MSLSVKELKWKKKGPSNRRIGMSSVTPVKDLSVDNIDSQLGNQSLTGGHAKQPKQGRRL